MTRTEDEHQVAHASAPQADPELRGRPAGSGMRWTVAALAGVTAATAAVLFVVDQPAAITLLACAYIGVVGLWPSVIDFRTHRLPNVIIFPSYAVVAALLALYAADAHDVAALGRAAAAAALTGALYAAMNRWGSMGRGDVKLGVLLALLFGWLGWDAVISGPVVGFLLAFVVALGLVLSGKGRNTYVAFAPYLVGGALITICRHFVA